MTIPRGPVFCPGDPEVGARQRIGVPTSAQSIPLAACRVHAKIKGQQNNSLMVSKRRLEASLQRSLLKVCVPTPACVHLRRRRRHVACGPDSLVAPRPPQVNRAYIEFQKAVEALVKEGSRGRTAPSKGPGAIPSPAHDSGSFSGEVIQAPPSCPVVASSNAAPLTRVRSSPLPPLYPLTSMRTAFEWIPRSAWVHPLDHKS